jgi:glycerophosphoryl diester phosphodiesterase
VNEAIKRGYWMIEVDIWETKDGIAIAQHDPDFQRFYGHSGKASEMTWEEIKKLRSNPGNERPLLFEELVALCKGKLFLMLDTKAPHSPGFCSQIEAILKKHDLLSSAYVIGTPESREYFRGKAKVGVNRQHLKQAIQESENVQDLYYLFEHGNELDEATVSWSQELGVTVVPSVNTFHYKTEDPMEGAKEDIAWLKKAGVTEFQIDSEYDRWFE